MLRILLAATFVATAVTVATPARAGDGGADACGRFALAGESRRAVGVGPTGRRGAKREKHRSRRAASGARVARRCFHHR